MPIAPRLLGRRPPTGPSYSPLGYTRLWAATNKNGNVVGSAATDTGMFAVARWDGTTKVQRNGTFGAPATSLLLNFNGSNGSTSFLDSSPNGVTVTASGNAQISTDHSKFGVSSGYFDGSGDYISGSAAISLSGDFTIEFWFRRVGTGSGAVMTIFQAGDIQAGRKGLHLYVNSTGTFSFDDAATASISGGSAPLNQWVHVAVVRNAGVNTLYVDGVAVGSSDQVFEPINTNWSIGGSAAYGFYTNAYIDDFQVTSWQAKYSANFTPPTAPGAVLPAESGQRAFSVYPATRTGSLLLLNFNSDASDSSGRSVPTESTAVISTAQSMFGGASAQFSGVVTSVSANVMSLPRAGVGGVPFTISLWVRANAASALAVRCFASQHGGVPQWGGTRGVQWSIFRIGNVTHFKWTTPTGTETISGGSVAANVWHHVAVTYDGTTTRLFVDGVMVGTNSNPYGAASNAGTISLGNEAGSHTFGGFIDDFHVLIGQPAWTSNFTPPTSPQSPVSDSIVPFGQFDAFDLSGNAISRLRAESVSLSTSASLYAYGYHNYANYSYVPPQVIPGGIEQGNLSNNAMSAAAIDQFYSDLLSGTGSLYVAGNPGIASDTPAIATAKGYTVYGSEPP